MADTGAYAATFEIVDGNKDGHISATELKQLMKALGEDITEETATEVVQRMDSDGDGEISLEEFATYMAKG
ncbi:EF-hand domain-containing protein [Actinoallomurus sp. NBC_01490]|jgi:Ca2+-binding EF-hand superfamily protein|uniref:EF-hand domain-containing protein n=1 Tax=Actinoallomurus sp. NBC_01490 TaxID=2903557 RepID=UPI002E37DA5A|nr:EF-hand domain-containing protein [Actinoallomurus sp. NBC_01490]